MKKLILTGLLLFSSFSTQVFATNFYVRKGATGNNTGTDWANAWNELRQIRFSTLSCGDTVWIAGGTYTSALKGNKSCTAGHALTFARVQSTDSIPKAALGWESSYDSQVVLPYIDIPGPSAYITITGRIPNGILVQIPGSSGTGIDGGNGVG